MSQFLHQLFFLVSFTFSSSLLILPARGQISSDGTTNTTVEVSGNNDFTINQGDRAGSNLFHSFQEFSVPTGGKAFFNNAADIVNIFSRVTGGKLSNIDGMLRANGTANLFLLNPAGIIFGPNASLGIGGSFLGSTADSIFFTEGEFSATDLDNPPLITINAPIGLNFRETAESITNRSRVEVDADLPGRIEDRRIAGLRVKQGNTLALIGGDLVFEGGNLTANGGRIELGSVEPNNFVNLTPTEQGFILNYDEVQNFQDISLFPGTIVDTSSDIEGGGGIQVQGRQVKLTGDAIASPVLIFSNTESEGQGESIVVNASESIDISGDFAGILTQTDGTGSAGNIEVGTKTLLLRDGGFILSNASLNEIGSAGDVTINTTESVELIGVDSDGFLPTEISSDGDLGNGGNLIIDTKTLSVRDGAQISTTTFGNGQAGNLEITSDSIVLSGFSQSDMSDIQISGIFVSTQPGSTGDAGKLTINANNLTIEKGARISANTRGPGQGSEVTLNLDQLVVQTGGEIGAGSLVDEDADSNERRGDGGTLTINADDSIEVIGTNNINNEAVSSRIFTLAQGTGNAGELNITTNQLTVADGGEINASATGTGVAGTLKINADNIDLDQGSLTATTAAGDDENIRQNIKQNIQLIVSENLTLRNNSEISAAATNNADGGNVSIVADFILGFPSIGSGSDILANAGEGKGGNINILTQGVLGFEVSKGLQDDTNDIDASSQTTGLDGVVTINNPDVNPLQGVDRLPTNPVSADSISSEACSPRGEGTTLIIKGKGGIYPEPTALLTADALIPDGKPITLDKKTDLNSLLEGEIEQEPENPNYIPDDIKPVKTDNGDIYPARGIVKTADGKIILTAYPTTATTTRTPGKKLGCS